MSGATRFRTVRRSRLVDAMDVTATLDTAVSATRLRTCPRQWGPRVKGRAASQGNSDKSESVVKSACLGCHGRSDRLRIPFRRQASGQAQSEWPPSFDARHVDRRCAGYLPKPIASGTWTAPEYSRCCRRDDDCAAVESWKGRVYGVHHRHRHLQEGSSPLATGLALSGLAAAAARTRATVGSATVGSATVTPAATAWKTL